MQRGSLTKEIQELAVSFLGREIDIRELRLYPYIDNVVKNFNDFSRDRVNAEEYKIIKGLEENGYIILIAGKLFISREMYDFISSVLALSYVDFDTFEKLNKVGY